MELLQSLFGKKKSGTSSRARVGKLYKEDQLLQVQGTAMDREADRGAPRSSGMQSVEFVLDAKRPPPLREFVKLVEDEAAMPTFFTENRTVVLLLDTKPSDAAEQVVKFVERQDVSPSAPVQMPPVELLLDPSHPLALREIMKFAVAEAINTFSPAPQRRVRLVLDTRQPPISEDR